MALDGKQFSINKYCSFSECRCFFCTVMTHSTNIMNRFILNLNLFWNFILGEHHLAEGGQSILNPEP